jgi:hypothetical protein
MNVNWQCLVEFDENAYIWLSAFMSNVQLQVLAPHLAGEVLPKF